MKPYIVTQNGLTIDLSQVKCFKHILYDGDNTLTVEFKVRYEYLLDPNTGEFVKQEIHDKAEFIYRSYDELIQAILEWKRTWQKYLDTCTV
jgi:hypothetical protein